MPILLGQIQMRTYTKVLSTMPGIHRHSRNRALVPCYLSERRIKSDRPDLTSVIIALVHL